MKVLLTTNYPSPYTVGYANELGKLCELTVVSEMAIAKNRDKSWLNYGLSNYFNLIVLNAIPFSEASGLSFRIKKIIKNGNFDRIIIGNPTTPTGIIAEFYCRRKRIPFIIQSEGGFQGSGRGLKHKLKKFLMEKAVFYLSGMSCEDDYFYMYGGTKERIKSYPFASLYQNEINTSMISEKQKIGLRKKLNIKEKTIILYIGQFIHRKGVDILLKACSELSDDVGLYLIGGRRVVRI
jgi:glycosyltransferase involved in cell wall biosynthesis